MENTEARVRGTLKTARMKPSDTALPCVHLPYTDFGMGRFAAELRETPVFSPIDFSGGVFVKYRHIVVAGGLSAAGM